jgi:hypothetical protein
VRRSESSVFVAVRKCLLLYFHWIGALFEYGVVAISRHSDQGFFFALLDVGQERGVVAKFFVHPSLQLQDII